MSEQPPGRSRTSQGFAIALSGFGIGCLVGLSISPVVGIVITSVVGGAAAVVATLSGLDEKPVTHEGTPGAGMTHPKPSAWPLALLVIGLLAGSLVGISVRNNHWFGSDASSEIARWTQLGVSRDEVLDRLFEATYPPTSHALTMTETESIITQWTQWDLPKEEVARRLFNQAYPAGDPNNRPDAGDQNSPSPFNSILFSQEAAEGCESLLAAIDRAKANSDDQAVMLALKTASSQGFRRLAEVGADPQVLSRIIEDVICAKN